MVMNIYQLLNNICVYILNNAFSLHFFLTFELTVQFILQSLLFISEFIFLIEICFSITVLQVFYNLILIFYLIQDWLRKSTKINYRRLFISYLKLIEIQGYLKVYCTYENDLLVCFLGKIFSGTVYFFIYLHS